MTSYHPVAAPTLTHFPVPASSSYRPSINMLSSNYPELQNEERREFKCQLCSTAASQNTVDVLDTSYFPSVNDVASSHNYA
jgi:hypothetical protein